MPRKLGRGRRRRGAAGLVAAAVAAERGLRTLLAGKEHASRASRS